MMPKYSLKTEPLSNKSINDLLVVTGEENRTDGILQGAGASAPCCPFLANFKYFSFSDCN